VNGPHSLVGWLVHDLRRSGARETQRMFDRYNIIDEADLAAAVAKRFNSRV